MMQPFRLISSIKVTVVCLFLLFVLTLWGTVAQVEHGLYAAQERYFFSFVFLAGGWFPVPGAQLVLWVLCINLSANLPAHFARLRGWSSGGIKLVHLGIMVYFLSAFMIFHSTEESAVRLGEGQSTNVSASYTDWELSFWTDTGMPRQVTAIDIRQGDQGRVLPFAAVPWQITLEKFVPNADPAVSPSSDEMMNSAGITALIPKPIQIEREKNIAGAAFSLALGDGKTFKLLLYGGDASPTVLKINGVDHQFMLRRKRFELPFAVTLKDFQASFYPGTDTPKSFESMVEIQTQGGARDVRIYMNNPLRYKNYTMYQAAYDVDEMGRMASTFAVVKNSGQFLPYMACGLVFAGLLWHFIGIALRRKRT